MAISFNHDRVVLRDFQTLILCGHENLPMYDIPQVFHDFRVWLCLANSIDLAQVPPALLQNDTTHWKNTEAYPPECV